MEEKDNTAVLEPALKIAKARPEDMAPVVRIIRSSASWYEEFVDPDDLDQHYVDQEWARENFRKREFYVGRIEDSVAGTISLQEAGSDHLYLGYVYLHVDHVGNGFGRDLLDFAESEARRRGRSGLVLLAHPEAEWACRAYEKYGFEVIARDRDAVLGWQNGWLEPYYEEGFHLFELRL